MRIIYCLLFILFFFCFIQAEQSDDAPIIIPVEQVKTLQERAKDARLASLEYANLDKEIQLAMAQLAKLKTAAEKAEGERKKVYDEILSKAGVDITALEQYDQTVNSAGELVFRKKAKKP